MHLEVLHTPPSSSSFTPLPVHQSQTPSSFFSSTPVLHFSTRKADLLISAPEPAEGEQVALPPLFRGPIEGDSNQVLVGDIDVWVTSASLILYSETKGTGVEVPYPAISLHAIQRLRLPGRLGERQGLYMQIELGGDGGYEEDGPWEITVVPSAAPEEQSNSSTPADENMSEPTTTSTTPPQETITTLFSALSVCSNLHPDPEPSSPASSDEDPIVFEGSVGYESLLPTGDLPPPFPGSGGWITAENMGEHFDEEGRFKKRRGREDDGGGEEGEEGGEEKWRRTG